MFFLNSENINPFELDIFNCDYRYKVKFLGYMKTSTKQADFYDLYFETHGNYYRLKIDDACRVKDKQIKVKIDGSEEFKYLKSPNTVVKFLKNNRPVLEKLNYYIFEKPIILTDIKANTNKSINALSTNAFYIVEKSYSNKDLICNIFENGQKKCTRNQFIKQIFNKKKSADILNFLKDNDNFQVSCYNRYKADYEKNKKG